MSGARRMAASAAMWSNRLLLAGLIAQFYTAGLAIFGLGFGLHGRLGWTLIAIALLAALLAGPGFGLRSGRFRVAWGLVLVTALQPILIFVLGPVSRALAALHPLNALVAVTLAVYAEWSGRAPNRPRRTFDRFHGSQPSAVPSDGHAAPGAESHPRRSDETSGLVQRTS